MTTDTNETTADRFGLTGTKRSLGLAGLARKTTAAPADTALTLDTIPDPDAAAAGADPDRLTDDEARDLELCERAARSHHTSYWLTGKALDTIAKRRLYRAKYPTFEALLADWDITQADSSRMRRGWPLAARLLVECYDIDAAVTLHALLRDSLPKVTARDIQQIVASLPGPHGSSAPAAQIRDQVEEVLTYPDDDPLEEAPRKTTADDLLRQAVDKRARQLANDLKCGRIPRQELTRTLTEAFADPNDPTVYKALLRWMKAHGR
ncbi:hypothetical protein ABZ918_33855 [Streptomyces viridosporus]|uniref:hypothetical protein n=1 Tax=Streptomyces viridosporus TaxID=67581 RepID=UPI00341B84A8